MALTTLDKVKCFLGLKTDQENSRLLVLVEAVSAAIKQYTDREFEQATYTEFYSGDGLPILQLRQRPVTSITTIHVDSGAYYGQAAGAFDATTLLTPGTDYALVYDGAIAGSPVSRRGHVERIGRVWTMATNSRGFYPSWYDDRTGGLSHEPPFPRGGNIKVVYVAGFSTTTMPKDVELAANLYVAMLRRTSKFGGDSPQSERLGEYQYSLFAAGGAGGGSAAAEIGTIRQLLSRYREVAI